MKKQRYRVLISTRSIIALVLTGIEIGSYKKWQDNYKRHGYSLEYLNKYRTFQGNQVNYFIPID